MESVDNPIKTKGKKFIIMENNLLQIEKYRFMNFFYFEIRNRVMLSLQRVSLVLFFVLSPFLAQAQDYDLLLKGGRLIDAKNKIDARMDVAVKDGKISRVAADIPASAAKKVLDVSGLIVAPGLINIHTHVFAGSNPERRHPRESPRCGSGRGPARARAHSPPCP